MIRSALWVGVLLCVTGGFQGFDLFFVLTNGGPYGATEIPTTYLVKTVFRNGEVGYGSAMAVVLTVDRAGRRARRTRGSRDAGRASPVGDDAALMRRSPPRSSARGRGPERPDDRHAPPAAARQLALLLLAFMFFFPMIWMVMSSFKTNADIFSAPFSLPETIDFGALGRGLGGRQPRAVRDQLGDRDDRLRDADPAVRRRRPRSRSAATGSAAAALVLGLFALGLILPLQSYFIAQSSMFTLLGITDTRLRADPPYAAMGLSLAVYLLKVYLDALPEELFEAARIDGASDRQLFGSLALPLLRPGLATVAIFSALAAWNEFLLALLYIQDDSLKTIPTGLLAFSTRYVTDYSLLFSALSIVTIPMIVIYFVFNRQIVEGITAGSVK